MKKIIYTFVICLFTVPIFSQWSGQAPVLPQNQGVYDISISPLNDQVVWSICNNYTIHTNFFEQDISTNQLMIARSGDGGNTWSGAASPFGSGMLASNISPVSDSIAWISYINGNGGFIVDGLIFKTVDGGATWEQQLQTGYQAGVGFVNQVYFWDTETGITLGDPAPDPGGTDSYFEIWRTTNGGDNWVRIQESAIPSPQSFELGWSGHGSYDVIGSTIWFTTFDLSGWPAVNGNRLFKSTDQGLTWEAYDFPELYGISFADHLNGIALKGDLWVGGGQSNTPIYRTIDGGETWEASGSIMGAMTTSAELIPGSLSIIATTRENNFGSYHTRISHDWGQTWTVIDTSDNFVAALSFANPSVGYGGDWQRVPAKPFKMYKYSGNPVTGIFSNNQIEGHVEIIPNPTPGHTAVDVNLPVSEDFVVLINDITGRLVTKFEAYANGPYSFDLSSSPPGAYILTLVTSKGFLTRKFLKH